MSTTQKGLAGSSRMTFAVSRVVLGPVLVWAGICCGGCGPGEQMSQAAPAEDSLYTITIDREVSAASVAAGLTDPDWHSTLPRTLSFEMVGFANQPTIGSAPERRAAAIQAAIIDSFCRALIEARRSRGRTAADFTTRMGPRLTVTHHSLDDGCEITIDVLSRGLTTTFVVRNGVLQHPPCDLRSIRNVFDETNGEFSLLEATGSSTTGVCFARVACYLPAGFDTAIAGNVPVEQADEVP